MKLGVVSVAVALVACAASARADPGPGSEGAALRAAGTVLLSAVSPAAITGIVLYTRPSPVESTKLSATNRVGVGVLIGAASLFAVGLPLFLAGESIDERKWRPRAALLKVGVARVELDLRF
jgi:hypothetical protein